MMSWRMHEIIAPSIKMGHPDIPEYDRQTELARDSNILKLNALMEAVIKDKIFGEVVAHVRVTEARIGSSALHLHSRPSFEQRTTKSVASRC